MIEKVRKAILENGLIARGETVAAGISGGADSTALAITLKELESSMGFRVAAAHFNHCIRGESADNDENFVRKLCADYDIPLFCGREDVPGFASENGLSVETAGRILRYEFLKKIRKQTGAAVIATAHHADDNAESVLLHFVRGSGLKGLCGMEYKHDKLIHPLLGIRRSEIEDFLSERGIPYCTDETNFLPEGSRNIVRLKLLPLIEKELNADAVGAVNRCAELLRQDENYLFGIAENALDKAKTAAGYDRNALKALPMPILSRAIRIALTRAGAAVDIEKLHVENIAALLEAQSGASCSVPHANVRISFSDIIFSPVPRKPYKTGKPAKMTGTEEAAETEKTEKTPETGIKERSAASVENEIILLHSAEDTGRREFPFGSFESSILLPPCEISADGNIAFLDLEKLRFPLTVRGKIPGDRFRPANSSAGKKLKDYFIERKVDSEKRNGIPLVISDGKIVFVAGFGICDEAKVIPETKKILRIVFRKKDGN